MLMYKKNMGRDLSGICTIFKVFTYTLFLMNSQQVFSPGFDLIGLGVGTPHWGGLSNIFALHKTRMMLSRIGPMLALYIYIIRILIFSQVRVNLPAVKRRVESLAGRRTVKQQWQVLQLYN